MSRSEPNLMTSIQVRVWLIGEREIVKMKAMED